MRERVIRSRQAQRDRFADLPFKTNAEIGPRHVREVCSLRTAAQNLMRTAMDRMHLTARSFHRVLKVARTIADMDEADSIDVQHLAEALQYRPKLNSS